MNIPQGYKQTELGIIPEDWVVKPIGALGRIVGGGTPPTSVSQYWNGGIAWYTPAEIGDSKYLSYSVKTISELGLHSSSARLLPPGTILLTTRASIGLSAILRQAGTTNQGFQSVIVYDSYDNEFVYYLLQQYIDVMYSLASGSTFLEISKNKLAFINVAFPVNRIEQHAIAEALSDIDGLIVALDKKIAKKRLIKQGTMQQLLTGKKRLPGFTDPWVEKKLGEIGNIKMGQSPSSIFYNLEGKGLPLIQGNTDIVNRKSIVRIYTSQITKQCEAGDILLSIRAPVGTVGKASCKSCIGRGICAIEYANDYIYQYFIFIENNWDQYSKGSTFDSINSDELYDFKIKLPCSNNEQIAIATILSDMDKEITDLEAKRDKYRLLKSGMMQKLLTGQIRLTV